MPAGRSKGTEWEGALFARRALDRAELAGALVARSGDHSRDRLERSGDGAVARLSDREVRQPGTRPCGQGVRSGSASQSSDRAAIGDPGEDRRTPRVSEGGGSQFILLSASRSRGQILLARKCREPQIYLVRSSVDAEQPTCLDRPRDVVQSVREALRVFHAASTRSRPDLPYVRIEGSARQRQRLSSARQASA